MTVTGRTLALLAAKVRANTLNNEERAFVAELLTALARGESLAEALGVHARGRPPLGKAEQRTFEVLLMRQPSEFGGNDLTKEQAVAAVAERHNVSVSTLESEYKKNIASVREWFAFPPTGEPPIGA